MNICKVEGSNAKQIYKLICIGFFYGYVQGKG
jgi:hypothetical protein